MTLPNEVDPIEEGTTVETPTPAPADDPSTETAVAADPQPIPQGADEELLKRLESIDPTTLPATLRQRLESPFKADHTKKTQELSEREKKWETERAQLFEMTRKIIESKQGPAGPSAEDTKLKELAELASTGDTQASMQLADLLAERKVAPIRTQITLRNAYEEATRANPEVAKNWNEIYQVMTTDPVIAAMATANNFQGASKVMIALGQERELMALRPAMAAKDEQIKALEAKLQTYEKERVAGLPSSTTRAGTTAGRPTVAEPRTLEEVDLVAAWVQAGGTPDTFR